MIIIDDWNVQMLKFVFESVQMLKFVFESKLDEIVGSSVSSSSVLLRIDPMVADRVMTLAAWAYGRRVREGVWAYQGDCWY